MTIKRKKDHPSRGRPVQVDSKSLAEMQGKLAAIDRAQAVIEFTRV